MLFNDYFMGMFFVIQNGVVEFVVIVWLQVIWDILTYDMTYIHCALFSMRRLILYHGFDQLEILTRIYNSLEEVETEGFPQGVVPPSVQGGIPPDLPYPRHSVYGIMYLHVNFTLLIGVMTPFINW